jgi:hypothetical protein
MNPKKFKTVEECNARLEWLDLEIVKVAQNISTGFVSEQSNIARRLKNLKHEQARLFTRREALKTNELPFAA